MKILYAILLTLLISVGNAQTIQLGLDINGESGGDQSGSSIAISDDGHVVAIGATKNDGNGSSSGHVRVHRFDGNSWSQLGGDIDGESNSDESGKSVALNKRGNIVAIGAHLNRGSRFGFTKGHVRVYQFDGTSWTQLGGDINGESNGDWSGWSVSLSDDGYTVAIGAVLNDGGGQNSGHVRVYRFNGSGWSRIGADIDGQSASSFSGTSVSLNSNGNRVAIGSPGGGFGAPSGRASVFELDSTNTWIRMGNIIFGPSFQETGTSISLSDDGLTVAVGAPDLYTTGRSAGFARVYQFNGSTWVKVGADMVGETLDDGFGTSVALSGDGNTIIVGAPNNSSNGTSSGHARLFEFNGSAWIQIGSDFDGEAAGDNFGTSVAISNDGDMIAIGGINNDDGGSNSGHARVLGQLNPVACILANPNPVSCKQSVTFNAIQSYHLDTLKSIQSFEWDINDDGTIDNTDTSFTQVFNTTGVYTVELKVIDNLGQVDSSTIEITVIDTSAAILDSVFLNTIVAECSITPIAPTATDSCAGKITATSNVSFPITTQDTTVITWTFDDGSGNIITQQQTIIINDTTAPVPNLSNLPDIYANCEVQQSNVPVPTANDSCAGQITATPDVSFPIIQQDTTVVTWTFDDGNGNTITQQQNIIINDTIAPVPNASSLPDITAVCEVLQSNVPIPSATDACAGTIIANTNIVFPIVDTTIKSISWVFDDGNGNISTLNQNINWTPIDVSTDTSGFTIMANKIGATYQWLNCDSSFAPIANETSRAFMVTTNGNYAVEITEGNCVDTSECVSIISINIREIEALRSVNVFPNPNSGTINIDFGEIRGADIKLYNLLGQQLYQEKNIATDMYQFNMELESGIYFVEILARGAKRQFKITMLE